jgi:hypothetical protein
MAKIYALHYDEQRFKMKISCEKHWEQQKELLENSTDVTVHWNNCVLLSFSRSALVEKANEIKNKWLQKQYENISKIASIELRR